MGGVRGEFIQGSDRVVTDVAILIRQQLNHPTGSARIANLAQGRRCFGPDEPIIVSQQAKKRLQRVWVLELSERPDTSAPHAGLGVVKRADEFVKTARARLFGEEFGCIDTDHSVPVTKELGENRWAVGNSLEGDGRQVRAFGAQQHHNTHAQKRRGIRVLTQVMFNDIEGFLGVTLVEKRISSLDGGALRIFRATNQQEERREKCEA